MKRFKKLSVLLVFTLLATLFTGCTMEEKNLADAFIKNQDILSLESTTNLEFELTSEGLAADEQMMFEIAAGVVNNLSIDMLQRAVYNEDQTAVKGYAFVNVDLGEQSHDASIWVDMDMNGEDVKLKEVFRLPSIVKDLFPNGVADKKYMVLDLNDMMKTLEGLEEPLEEPMNFNETMEIAMKYQEKFMESIEEYIRKYDSKLYLLTRLQDKTIDGESIEVYQVKFDNDSFKEFLKYNIISILQDKEMISVFTDYMAEIFALSGETMPEEIDFKENIPEAIEKVKDFFESIEKINILGKDGIVINYGINEDGFLVSEEGKIDFLLDVKSIMEIAAEELEEDSLPEVSTPVFNFKISYDTKMSKINKNMKIYIPETTDKNSVSYMELVEKLMEDLMPETDREQELMIIVGENLLELADKPLLKNGTTFVPSRDIGDALDAKVEWNENRREITITKDDVVLVFNVDKNQVTKNGEEINLDSALEVIEGTGFVPLRFIAESLGYTVDWEAAGYIIIYQN